MLRALNKGDSLYFHSLRERGKPRAEAESAVGCEHRCENVQVGVKIRGGGSLFGPHHGLQFGKIG